MKSVVLLSAGLDSSYNFLKAQKEGQVVLALSFDYGQRAGAQELARASLLCKEFRVAHEVIDLKWFQKFSKSSLTSIAKLPLSSEVQIDDEEASKRTAASVWVPNRNGIFLSIAAGFAEGMGADQVVAGFNLEEAATFTDNSNDFMRAMTASLGYSTRSQVVVQSYSISMNKTQILQAYYGLGGQKEWLWPCYQGLDEWCKECESCVRFENAEKNVRELANERT